PTAPAPRPALPADEKLMSLAEHLGELRRRLIVSGLTVVAGSVIGWLVAPQVILILKAPIVGPLVFTQLGGAFMVQLKIALLIGVVLGSPMLLYQLWAFISPGLTERERRLARPWIPLALLFVVLGVAVAYLVLPYAAAFLLSFQQPGVLEPLITVEAYFGFATNLFLAFGLVMQFPIVVWLLSKVGLVTAAQLRHGRRYVLFGIVVLAAVVTPGGDPVSPTIMALVMYPLYELTIYLVGRSTSPEPTDG
ncbi:MAG TPA: twin-arginine translocase subunit TatC, partial [Candidatus Limnocylindrales bacterium]